MYQMKLHLKNKTLVFGHWPCSAFWANKNPKKYVEFGDKACFEPFTTKEIISLDACSPCLKKLTWLS